MAVRKNFKKLKSAATTQDAETESDDTNSPDGDGDEDLACIYPKPLYIADDLTRDKAKLAFTARGLKTQGQIWDTWVIDCNILVKDNEGRISKAAHMDDLKKFMR